MATLYWNRIKRLRFRIPFLICGMCIAICSCTNDHNVENGTEYIINDGNAGNSGKEYTNDRNAETDIKNITSEIEEYIQRFVSLYTSNALEDTQDQMIIEERGFFADNESKVNIIKYSDLSGNCLRYELHYYGETGNRTVNYYLCENFYWISDQKNYYSSWHLNPEYLNILYSEVDNWIVINEKTYHMHDLGDMDEMQEASTEILLLKDIEYYWESNNLQFDPDRA